MKNIETNQLKRRLRKERKMASQLSNHEHGIHEYNMKTIFSRLLTQQMEQRNCILTMTRLQ